MFISRCRLELKNANGTAAITGIVAVKASANWGGVVNKFQGVLRGRAWRLRFMIATIIVVSGVLSLGRHGSCQEL